MRTSEETKKSPFFIITFFWCALCDILIRFTSGRLFDCIRTGTYRKELIIVTALILGQIIGTYLKKYQEEKYLNRVQCCISKGLEKGILTISQSKLEMYTKGYLLNLLENDITYVIGFLRRFFERFLVDGILYLCSIVCIALIYPKLAVIAVVCSILPLGVMKLMGKTMEKGYERYQNQFDCLMNVESEGIFNLELLKMNGMCEVAMNRHREMLTETHQRKKSTAALEAGLSMPSLLCTFVTMIVLVSAAGFLLVDGKITGGNLLLIVTLVDYIVNPAMTLDGTLSAYKRGRNSWKRIQPIWEAGMSEYSVGKADMTGKIERISFQNVSFRYPKQDQAILCHWNAEFRIGRVNLLSGENGSGKSTVIRLLRKIYDCSSGKIECNGLNWNDISEENLDRKIAVCTQEIYLYQGTVRENLLLHTDKTQTELERICTVTGLAEEIRELPEGYDTVLNEEGHPLSIGQRQRMMLARTLLLERDVYIFDEPTSGFNPNVTGTVVQELSALAKTHLVIVITHDDTLFASEEIYRIKMEGSENEAL